MKRISSDLDGSALNECSSKRAVGTPQKVAGNFGTSGATADLLASDGNQASPKQLPRVSLVSVVRQLLVRNGPSAVAEVQRRIANRQGFQIRGMQVEVDVLCEALAHHLGSKELPATAEMPAEKAPKSSFSKDLAEIQKRRAEEWRRARECGADNSACAREDLPSPTCKPSVREKVADWHLYYSSLWVRDYGSINSDAIAVFDLDETLVTRCGLGKSEWQWLSPAVPARLRTLAKGGHKVVLFSNQRCAGPEAVDAAPLLDRIDAVQLALGVPLLVFLAIGSDTFRKPRVGSWIYMIQRFNGGVGPDLDKCFCVGAAAGRAAVQGLQKDSSDVDLKFALNLSIDFKTPEEFCYGKSSRPCPTFFDFDPRWLGKLHVEPLPAGLCPSTQLPEVVVMIGPPACGKSWMAATYFPEYVCADQGSLNSKEKCLSVCFDEALRCGKSVVVANQNRDANTRAVYIQAARACGAHVRAVFVDVPKEFCRHLNLFRALKTGGDALPQVALNMYWKNLELPTAKEGFEEIVTVTMKHFRPRGKAHDLVLLRSFLS